jgi:hypothetical protein
MTAPGRSEALIPERVSAEGGLMSASARRVA